MFVLQLNFSHIINLLINMPTTCYEELLSPVIPEDETGNDGKNLDAIDNILHFLDDQITKIEVRSLSTHNLSNLSSRKIFKVYSPFLIF